MDGRNLSKEIIPQYKKDLSVLEIAKDIPKFIQRVVNSSSYSFYGEYEIGSIYDIRNFNNMLVSSFICQLDYSNDILRHGYINLDKEFLIILTDDCFLFFEKFEKNPDMAKLIFWSTLFGLSDIQINNEKKKLKLSFYCEETKIEKDLRIIMNNILSFKEEIINRMNALRIIVEFNKDGKEKKILLKDIENMKIDAIEYFIEKFRKRIEREINYYNVNIYTVLIGKAIEYYSANDYKGKNEEYLKEMQNLLKRADVQKVMNESK